jgi:hypothetical protein
MSMTPHCGHPRLVSRGLIRATGIAFRSALYSVNWWS